MTTDVSSPPPDTTPGKLDAGVIRIAMVVVLGAIMSILDATVVAVAQNTFQDTFDTTAANAAWTMTGYMLALAAVIPISSWAAGKFGTKNVYLLSLVLFTAGSVLCAFAWSIESLVAFRVIQGLGGGLLMPVGMMILTKAAGPGRIGSVMAVLGIPMLLGPIGGPILGGWLIQIASWHWVFIINVPIGIAAFVYALVVLKGEARIRPPRLDIAGLLLLSPGLALFLFGVSSTNAVGGTFMAARVMVPMVVGAVLMAAFVWHAFRTPTPLLDLHLFANPRLTIAVVTMALFAIGVFGAMLLYPQYYIGVRGETTLMAGLLVAPQGIGAMITMPIAGRMTDRIGPGRFVLVGLVLVAIGLGGFMFLGPETSYWVLGSALFVQGLGMGMTMMPTMSAALATLRPQQVPNGSTLMNVVQQTATSIGSAVISVILANNLKEHAESGLAILSNTSPERAAGLAGQLGIPFPLPDVLIKQGLELASTAFSHTFVVAVGLVVLTLIPAFFLPRKRIEPSADIEEATPVLLH